MLSYTLEHLKPAVYTSELQARPRWQDSNLRPPAPRERYRSPMGRVLYLLSYIDVCTVYRI